MQIQQSALQRVRSAQFRPEAIANIFEHMAMIARESGAVATEFVLGYQQPDEPVEEGDYVPVIVLGLRPAQKPTKPAEST
jgi:hypothetical protein